MSAQTTCVQNEGPSRKHSLLVLLAEVDYHRCNLFSWTCLDDENRQGWTSFELFPSTEPSHGGCFHRELGKGLRPQIPTPLSPGFPEWFGSPVGVVLGA